MQYYIHSSGIYDGKISLWWTNNYASKEFELDELFKQEHINCHHITKTQIIVLKDGINTTVQLG